MTSPDRPTTDPFALILAGAAGPTDPYRDSTAHVADEVDLVLARLTRIAAEREHTATWRARRALRRLRNVERAAQEHVAARVGATLAAGRNVALEAILDRFKLRHVVERRALIFAVAHGLRNTEVELLCGTVEGYRRSAPTVEIIMATTGIPWTDQVRAMPLFTEDGALARSGLVELGHGVYPVHPSDILGASVRITRAGLLGALGMADPTAITELDAGR